MGTKTKDASLKRDDSGSLSSSSSSPNIWTDLGRRQLAWVADGTAVFYRNREALRQMQQEVANEASVFHEETARKLMTPCEPAKLMSIQAELLRFGVQSASKYWQQVAVHTVQMQMEVFTSASHLLDKEKDLGINSPLEMFQAVLPTLANGLFPMSAHVPEGQVLHS